MYREKLRSEREQLQQKDQSESDSDSSDSHYDYYDSDYYESSDDEEDRDHEAVIGLLSAHTEMVSTSSTHCVSITVLNTVIQR